MEIIRKIRNRVEDYYMHNIVKVQYPMLTSLSRRRLQKEEAIGLVYMLHHIKEKKKHGIPTNQDLIITPKFLEDLIINYKKQGFNFVSLDEVSAIISSGIKPKRPFIAFTIDDGYLDNFTQAFPIFERHQVPFAIFIATDFIDQKAILWWDIIEDLILNNSHIIMDGNDYRCHIFQEKWNIFRILREKILRFDQTQLENKLKSSFSCYDIDWYEPIRHQAMSWEHVKKISQHPLCTIGGHTVSHLALNKLNIDEFHREITEGLSKLERATGKSIKHFAYPYGSPNEVGEREYQQILRYNFRTVFLSYGGCITEKHYKKTNNLPRVYLHQ